MASEFADTAKAVCKSVVDKSVKGFFISPTWYGGNPLEYVMTTSIMDVWDDLREFVASPWYQPLVFTQQVLGPFWWFIQELLLKSPVFWIVSIFASARWVYNDYYRFLAVGRGGTPSTFYGWYRTKVLLFIANYILRVNVFGAPFLNPMFEPYRGILFDLPPRQGERPTILGLAPQRQGNQRVGPQTEAAMVVILERKAAENSETLVMEQSYLEGHLRALKRRLPAGAVPGTIGTTDSTDPRMLSSTLPTPQRFYHHTIRGICLPLPFNFVLVYAPRCEDEMAIFERIVDAAVWFHTLPENGENNSNSNPAPAAPGPGPAAAAPAPASTAAATAADILAPADTDANA